MGGVVVGGVWGAAVFRAPLNGRVFSAAKTVGETEKFPPAYLIVSGEIRENACTATVNGYSRDAERPGNFGGQINTSRR